ncbi:MAG: hypothetical protein ACLTDR_14160 [Adlercreutzia equolifaciens]
MFYLAWRNITRRLGSSVLTAFIAFMAVLALTASMIVVTSLEDGVRLSRERLGADVTWCCRPAPRAMPRRCSSAPSR